MAGLEESPGGGPGLTLRKTKMIDLRLLPQVRGPARVLCIGAHCDDIEIGCGATLRVLQRAAGRVIVDWVVLSGSAERQQEARRSMSRFVRPRCRGEILFGNFADGRLPSCYADVKDFFEGIKRTTRPDLIFCHEREDRHQDHRVVNEMVWSTFRDHLVFEYEIPKWDGGLGQPNVFVPISRRDAISKAETLVAVYRTQADRHWFNRETFLSMLRLRGLECRAPSGYAEAFHGRKVQVRLS